MKPLVRDFSFEHVEVDLDNIDWVAVRDRVGRILSKNDVSFQSIVTAIGLDPYADDYWERRLNLPPVQTTCTVAALLGVPALWLFTGEGNNPCQSNNMPICNSAGVSDSAIVQGNSGTVVISNNSKDISEPQWELLRICNDLPFESKFQS